MLVLRLVLGCCFFARYPAAMMFSPIPNVVRIVPYGILVSLGLLMLMCLAFCVLDQKERFHPWLVCHFRRSARVCSGKSNPCRRNHHMSIAYVSIVLHPLSSEQGFG